VARGRYPFSVRVSSVRAVAVQGSPIEKVCRLYGVKDSTLYAWVRRWRAGGPEALRDGKRGTKPGATAGSHGVKRSAVAEVKRAHPEYGVRRVRDELWRKEALSLTETTVRRMLRELGFVADTPDGMGGREHPVRRFERAAPMEMWQTDIFTFLLRKHERVYVAAFLDDHSRFVVSWAAAHQQKANLVMEALSRGIGKHGVPKEVLSDRGRQYKNWRGETGFEAELRRQGIRHVLSRPQHPETLGKIERFWKTLWDEFLSRTVFADFEDFLKRFALYVEAYNFQRPHQGLGGVGVVPADRFYSVQPHVRAAAEQSVRENALALALTRPTRKPFYVLMKLGSRELRITAAGRKIRIWLGEEAIEEIELPKEDGDEATEASGRVRGAGRRGGAEGGEAAEEADERISGVAHGLEGGDGGRGSVETEVPGDPVGVVGREERDGGGGGDAGVEADVRADGGEGAAGDAVGAGAEDRRGITWRGGSGRPSGEAGGGGALAAAPGAAVVSDAEDREKGPDHGANATDEEEAHPHLDSAWRDIFERLEHAHAIVVEPEGVGIIEEGGEWRGRVVRWERKLAGERAPSETHRSEVPHERRGDAGGEGLVHPGAEGAGGGEGAVRRGDAGDHGRNHGDGGGEEAGDLAGVLPDADAPGAGRDDRGGDQEASRAQAAEAGRGGAARAGEAAGVRERAADGEGGDPREPALGSERGDPGGPPAEGAGDEGAGGEKR
jgi:transposase InsO family protein